MSTFCARRADQKKKTAPAVCCSSMSKEGGGGEKKLLLIRAVGWGTRPSTEGRKRREKRRSDRYCFHAWWRKPGMNVLLGKKKGGESRLSPNSARIVRKTRRGKRKGSFLSALQLASRGELLSPRLRQSARWHEGKKKRGRGRFSLLHFISLSC